MASAPFPHPMPTHSRACTKFTKSGSHEFHAQVFRKHASGMLAIVDRAEQEQDGLAGLADPEVRADVAAELAGRDPRFRTGADRRLGRLLSDLEKVDPITDEGRAALAEREHAQARSAAAAQVSRRREAVASVARRIRSRVTALRERVEQRRRVTEQRADVSPAGGWGRDPADAMPQTPVRESGWFTADEVVSPIGDTETPRDGGWGRRD